MVKTSAWWLWCLMCIAFTGSAQVITVVDKADGQPLANVMLYSATPKAFVVTDARGQADISAFKGADTITLQLVGYFTLASSYELLTIPGFRADMVSSPVLLEQVVVSSYQEESEKETGIHIEPLSLKRIEEQGSYNLTDALTRVPGISSLSTGIAISKPVIRGLYGNRILVLFSGLRFDNQQWQDEHGLGLSDIGISRVEVIKGPLSLLYGTEAVGGVINIIEEQKPERGTIATDVGTELHSNTLGGQLQAGVKVNEGSRWWRIRLASGQHADYADGNGDRVLNSRFAGYYLKGSYGFTRNKWTSENHYHFSYNKFGFIFDGTTDYLIKDNRWSRAFAGPHHIVILNIVSSSNTIQLRRSTLKLDAGFQSNYRAEDEGGDELSLTMHLMTGQYSLKWNRRLSRKTVLIIANNSSVESNVNYGKRKIVPDATMAESALSAYMKHRFGKLIVEYGAGAGTRYINTTYTPTVNSEENEIDPFSQQRPFANGMLGVSIDFLKKFNLKGNVSTGVRAPNLAELSSNGLHEGVYTYEIGDPDMENEKNVNGDLKLSFGAEWFRFSVSGFYNHFDGYIFLDPTDEDWFGFPVYRFRQHDADLYGGEATASITPQFVKGLQLSAAYSGLVGELDNGDYLPYMPAQKVKPEIRYDREVKKKITSWYGYVNSDFVLEQTLVSDPEAETPAYTLVNAGAGFTIQGEGVKYDIRLAANNLLNEAYYDHLSRFKYFGLLNMGRDISINLKIQFIKPFKTTLK